jgi:hypothetical protein
MVRPKKIEMLHNFHQNSKCMEMCFLIGVSPSFVGGFNPSGKYECVCWGYYSQYDGKVMATNHVPNHPQQLYS